MFGALMDCLVLMWDAIVYPFTSLKKVKQIDCEHDFKWKTRVLQGTFGPHEWPDYQTGTCKKCGFQKHKRVEVDYDTK